MNRSSTAEYGEAGGAVDLRGLVVRIRDRAETGVAEQRDQRRPVPHVHQEHGQPGVTGAAGVVVVDSEPCQRGAKQPDVGASKDLPDGADDVPRYQQGHREQHQHRRSLPAAGRHRQRQRNPQRDFDQQHRQRKSDLAQQRLVQFGVAHDHLEPLGADEHAAVWRDDVLHGVIHDGHQGQDGRECNAHDDRKDQQPCPLIERFHASNLSSL